MSVDKKLPFLPEKEMKRISPAAFQCAIQNHAVSQKNTGMKTAFFVRPDNYKERKI